jgi:DNA-binding beta-propeller fold protein YncE
MVRSALVCSASLLLILASQSGAEDPATGYEKVHKIAVGGDGGWDYLSVDPTARRLYVSRGDRVVVVDIDNEKVVGELPDTPGVHGVAVAPDLGRGFTSNGRDATVTVFDLKTLKPIDKIKVGGGPDAIHFDPESNRVFTFNHGSKDATAVDPAEAKVVGTVPLDGVPEAAVSDGKGHVFVNIMDKAEVVEFDARTLGVLNRWSLSPGERPTGLALDREHRRLFSVCSANQKMIVMDADNGHVVGMLDIGRGSDGCAFDPEKHLAFSSNGQDGTLTIVREDGPDKFRVAATVPTQASARTITRDPKTHRIYLSAATFEPAPAGEPKAEPKKKGQRRNVVPGSFAILVVGE